jgi:hypothetical protein
MPKIWKRFRSDVALLLYPCLCILGAWEIKATSSTLLKEAIHRAGPISKELRGSPKRSNRFRTEELSNHRNEVRRKGAQLQGERYNFEREAAANQVFWLTLDTTLELVISCVANICCARMFRPISLLPPKGVNSIHTPLGALTGMRAAAN